MATLAAGASTAVRARSDATDHDLVAAVRAGDDRAFEALYGRYRRRISAYIFGMVKDHGRAEDLTQEVFLSALRRLRETDREIAFKPWIYEIAKNACIDAFRRARRAQEVSYDADDGLGPDDHRRLALVSSTPEAEVDAKQQLDHLRGAFDGLSETQHQILVMRELGGLSYREIGARLGMTRPAVESTLFRARRRLSDEYAELASGARCLRVQEIIESAGPRGLGARDQRRVGSHIVSCSMCRREARLAGLDAAALARRPVRSRIAALLPLPLVLRRRWLGLSDHAAQLSAAAAPYSDSGSGWLKAVAAAAAVALAGAGAGVEHHHAASSPPSSSRGDVPAFLRAHDAGPVLPAPARAMGGAVATHATSGPRRSVAARVTAANHSGGSTLIGSAAPQAASSPASSPGAAVPSAGGHGSGGGSSDPSAPDPSAGSSSSRSTAEPAGTSSTTATAPTVTAPSTAPLPSAPAVDPVPSVPQTSGATTPVGKTVTAVTDTVGEAIGGPVGKTVEGVGDAVGATVDATTTVVGNTVKGTTTVLGNTVQGVTNVVGGVAKAAVPVVGGVVQGVTAVVGATVKGVLDTTGAVVDGVLTGRDQRR